MKTSKSRIKVTLAPIEQFQSAPLWTQNQVLGDLRAATDLVNKATARLEQAQRRLRSKESDGWCKVRLRLWD